MFLVICGAVAVIMWFALAPLARSQEQHPPAGAPDPYTILRNAENYGCCGSQDCHPIPAAMIRYTEMGLELLDHRTSQWLPIRPEAIVIIPEELRIVLGGGLHVCVRGPDTAREVVCIIMDMM